ncbi:MAG: putative Ig domain-containing protein, partial [Planctomycetota bacterium]
GTTVTPNAAPTDNGSVISLTASAPGFSGTLVGNPATGAITITNANPAGNYTVTVTATDNCGAQATTTFSLAVNAANALPTISGATISRQKGSPASTSQIATVGDANQACNTLSVTATPASGSGVTLSGISVNASCQVTANVIASCTATNSTFNLTVTDNQGATATALLTVNVTNNSAPSLGTYPATSVTAGGGATVSPNAAPSDNGSIASVTATAPGFTGTFAGNPTTGVITITNANPPGNYTVTVRVTDNCGVQTTRTFALTVNASGCSVTVNPAAIKQPYLAVPYVEPLSASPAGTYTFSVSAGALPPGLQLVTTFGVTSIAGLPTKPGTFAFTIKAKRNNSACEGTRSYTVTIPATVVPILECVQLNANGTWTARFGYDNSTGAAVTIPVGANNYFTPGSQNRGQTTVFQPGRIVNAFSVTFTKGKSNNLAVWYLKGPDNVLRPVSVLTTSLGCP